MLKSVSRIALLLLTSTLGSAPQAADNRSAILTSFHSIHCTVTTTSQLVITDCQRHTEYTAPLITHYQYDGNGNGNRNRTAQTRPMDNTWTYAYDERDRLIQISDPDNHTTTYRHDGNGNRLSQTDSRGHTTEHDYDTLDRLIQADYPSTGLTGELQRIRYQYDPNNNLERISEQHQGQSERITLNRHDAFDRLEAVIDSHAKEQRYSFDANGNRTSLRDPDGIITRYDYDELNRLASVNSSAGTTQYSYDRSSRKTRITYPNGSRADYQYDSLGRLEQLNNTQHGASVSQFSYRYDSNGNRIEQTENNGSGAEATTYVYDDLDRLIEVSYPAQTVSYGYDAAYNRTSERTEEQGVLTSDKTHAYDNRNRLSSITDHHDASQSVSYGYDANGNQTSKTENGLTTQFVYDARDKLVSLSHNGSSLGEYRYDYQGMHQFLKV